MNETVHIAPVVKSSAKSQNRVGRPSARTNDPERTMAEILKVAMHEFADKGLSGARIDEIAAATRTSKRMIYYYFNSKEGLYLRVLEEAYRKMRQIESELHLEDLAPIDALRRLVEFTFDHHMRNEDYIRLVMSENINYAAYLAKSERIQTLNLPAISAVQKLYERGIQAGAFRKGLDPVDIHASISGLTFFNVSNQYTFGHIFKRDLKSTAWITARRSAVVDMVLRYVQK
jgi:AcrR family transcriptional regulator